MRLEVHLRRVSEHQVDPSDNPSSSNNNRTTTHSELVLLSEPNLPAPHSEQLQQPLVRSSLKLEDFSELRTPLLRGVFSEPPIPLHQPLVVLADQQPLNPLSEPPQLQRLLPVGYSEPPNKLQHQLVCSASQVPLHSELSSQPIQGSEAQQVSEEGLPIPPAPLELRLSSLLRAAVTP